MRDGFVAIDLETTGLDPKRDAIVELAAVVFADGRPAEPWVARVNPGRPIPPSSSRIHGITDAMVADAPGIRQALAEFDEVCGDRVCVGHGIDFDLAVLTRARRAHRLRARRPAGLDTARLSRALHPEWARWEFDEVAARLGIGILGRHTAEADAVAAGAVLLVLIDEARAAGVTSLGDLLLLQESVP